jgi:cytochrome c2
MRLALALAALVAILPLEVAAAPDAAEGKKLVAEKNCETCHHNKTLGDAKAVYLRKDRKVTSIEKLKAQVAVCNSELGLQLFPDDEEHIVAYLNQTYYKFAPAKP